LLIALFISVGGSKRADWSKITKQQSILLFLSTLMAVNLRTKNLIIPPNQVGIVLVITEGEANENTANCHRLNSGDICGVLHDINIVASKMLFMEDGDI
jgi:hypothetical protein